MTVAVQPPLLDEPIPDLVQEYIDGSVQARVDIAHCRENFAHPDFMLERMTLLFGGTTAQRYQQAYCRSWQKHVEQSGPTSVSIGNGVRTSEGRQSNVR